MAKEFNIPNFADFEIKDDGKIVGHIRVKPSGIAWSPSGEHSWYRVSLDEFAKFAKVKGTKQKK